MHAPPPARVKKKGMSVPPRLSLLHAVEQAAFAKRSGARVTEDSSGLVYVYDCSHWGRANARLLQIARPNAEFSIESSTVSLSGFVVTVYEPPAPVVQRKQWLAGLATLAVLTFVAWSRWLPPRALAS